MLRGDWSMGFRIIDVKGHFKMTQKYFNITYLWSVVSVVNLYLVYVQVFDLSAVCRIGLYRNYAMLCGKRLN